MPVIKPSQIPELSQRGNNTWSSPTQPLKLPITDTLLAAGAKTAK